MPLPSPNAVMYRYKKFFTESMKAPIKVRITQVRSSIDCPRQQKETLRALGLRHRMHTVEKELNPAIIGMLRKVSHLVKIEHLA